MMHRATAWMWGAAAVAASTLAAPASDAQSCLTGARSVEKASPAETDYVFGSDGHAVDARGVSWLEIPDHALALDGAGDGCWSGGRVDGPYGEGTNVYYECTAEHGYTSGECLPYHTTAGMAPDEGSRVIEDVHIKDYGDGISVESGSGDILARRVWFENLHDDALETDYAQQSLRCVDCLFEKVWTVEAYRRRSSASGNVPKPGLTMELRSSLVRLHRFAHSYKEKIEQGSLYKDDDFDPQFVVTDNVYLLGPEEPGKVFPTAGTTVECRNNLVLWQGTLDGWENVLDDKDNRANLAALSNCFTVIVKPPTQSAADFRKQRWDPLVAQWKATHAAAGGNPGATPAPTTTAAPTRTPTPTATPVPSRTAAPTAAPTRTPTPAPTRTATPAPTRSATPLPTPLPTPSTTARPTGVPTATPSPNAPNEPPQEPILLP